MFYYSVDTSRHVCIQNLPGFNKRVTYVLPVAYTYVIRHLVTLQGKNTHVLMTSRVHVYLYRVSERLKYL